MAATFFSRRIFTSVFANTCSLNLDTSSLFCRNFINANRLNRLTLQNTTCIALIHSTNPVCLCNKPKDGENMARISENRLHARSSNRRNEDISEPGPDLLSMTNHYDEFERSEKRAEKLDSYGRDTCFQQSIFHGKGKPSSKRSNVFIPNVRGEILFGIHPVLLALKQLKRTPFDLYLKKSLLNSDKPEIREIIDICGLKEVRIQPGNKSLLDRLSYQRPHQGVCLDATKYMYQDMEHMSLEKDDKRKRVWLYLDSIQDPMNFGAIIRSSYFLGVEKIIVPKRDSCSPSPIVSKASSGALEVMDIYAVKDAVLFIEGKKDEGWDVVGTAVPSSDVGIQPLHETRLRANSLIIIGNEAKGLSPNISSLCNRYVAIIPGRNLAPGVDSLNVSTATGILLHQLLHNT